MQVKTSNIIKHTYIAFFILVLFTINSFAEVMVEINNIKPDKIEIAGFELADDQTVTIELYGLQPYRNRHRAPYTYAWILNAETRKLVWDSEDGDIDRERRGEYSCTDEIDLQKGIYEVYYAAFPYFYDWEWEPHHGFAHFLGRLFGAIFDEEHEYYNYDYDDLFIRVEGKGKGLREEDVLKSHEDIKDKALVSFSPLGRERIRQSILKVSKQD